jgi:hypothetical protein
MAVFPPRPIALASSGGRGTRRPLQLELGEPEPQRKAGWDGGKGRFRVCLDRRLAYPGLAPGAVRGTRGGNPGSRTSPIGEILRLDQTGVRWVGRGGRLPKSGPGRTGWRQAREGGLGGGSVGLGICLPIGRQSATISRVCSRTSVVVSGPIGLEGSGANVFFAACM